MIHCGSGSPLYLPRRKDGGGAAASSRQARSASGFDRALALPVAGLTLAMLLYGGGFLAVGGEWFPMWQSKVGSGSDAAARFFLLNAAVLVVLRAGRAPAGVEP